MKSHTYTVECLYDSECMQVAEFVRFEVTEQDYRRWKELSEIARDKGLFSVEISDYRCEFLDEGEKEGAYIPVDFSQATSRVVIDSTDVWFAGFETKGGPTSEWESAPISLRDIASDLGLEEAEAEDEDEIENKPFTFQNIDFLFGEATYLRAQGMIHTAAGLFGDGAGVDLGENPEYERGMAELICDGCGIPMYLKEEVIAEIHATARAAA